MTASKSAFAKGLDKFLASAKSFIALIGSLVTAISALAGLPAWVPIALAVATAVVTWLVRNKKSIATLYDDLVKAGAPPAIAKAAVASTSPAPDGTVPLAGD